MAGKLLKVFVAFTMFISLMLVKNAQVYAAETNLETETGAFTKPGDIHEDADLLSELDVIGKKLNEKEMKTGADVYRWLLDINYLNSKYSNSVSSTSIKAEYNRALKHMPFETKDEKGNLIYTGNQYYSDMNTVLTSLQKEIKGEKPFSPLRDAKDQDILNQIKSGKSYSDLRENSKMSDEDETYFNTYYQKGQGYRDGTIKLDDYKDWINNLRKLNKKYPDSSVYRFLSDTLDYAYEKGLSDYYDQIFGALNSLWDQTHYDFAHVTSNTLDSIEINQMPSVTTYTDGETFKSSGLVIDGTYKQVWSYGRKPTTYTVNNMNYTTDTSTKLTYYDNKGSHITSWPVTVNDGVTSKTINVPIIVKPKLNSTKLSSITVVSQPKKTTYVDGSTFNSDGLSIKGTYTKSYSDGKETTEDKNNMSYSIDNKTLTYGQTSVTAKVSDGDVQLTTEIPVTVTGKLNSTKLSSIQVVTQPKKTAYIDGDSFKSDGLSIQGTYEKSYSDGSQQYETKDNMSYSIVNRSLSVGQKSVTASVTSDGVTKTVEIPVTVSAKLNSTKLTGIAVKTQPTKTVYNEGDSFDPTGLVITGTYTKTYSDSTTQSYTQDNMDYSVVDGDSLKSTQKSVKIKVSDNGVEKTVEVPVTVNKYVKSASIDQLYFVSHPNKVKYKAGDKITTKGMKVNAVIKKTMSDGSVVYKTKKNVKVITSYPYAVAQIGSTVLTITYKYNENGFNDSKDLTQNIEVNKKDTHLVNVDKPAKVKIKSIKAGKKKFTVKWKKAKHARKYKVYYRVKGTKKWKSKSVKKTSCTVKKLKSKKTYQVRVRAINLTLKGKYSKTKTVKVK